MDSVQTSTPLRLEALTQVEASCRDRLTAEPADVPVRKKLAWCLFLLALHQAGQETLLPLAAPAGDANSSGGVRYGDRDARQLLRECLRQMVAVRQLATDPQDLLEIERLQSLVRLSGGEAELTAAEHEARAAIAKMTRELMEFPLQRQPARRRSRRLST